MSYSFGYGGVAMVRHPGYRVCTTLCAWRMHRPVQGGGAAAVARSEGSAHGSAGVALSVGATSALSKEIKRICRTA